MKALIISNRPSGWEEKINHYKTFMPFLSGIVVVSPLAMIDALDINDSYLTFVDEDQFISKESLSSYGLNGFEHASFNFILRTSCILSERLDELLGDEFLMLDDDNIPLSTIDIKTFYKNNRYQAYYYQQLDYVVPEKFCSTSYNVSLIKTCQMLNEKGINKALVYSSHMPQLINRTIFKAAYSYFDLKKYGYMICDWSLYFNYAIKHHPEQFDTKRAPVICWPMNISSVPTYVEPSTYLFENYDAVNYKKSGLFYLDDESTTLSAEKKRRLFSAYVSTFSKKKAWVKYYVSLLLNRALSKRLMAILLDTKAIPTSKKSLKKLISAYRHSPIDPYRLSMRSRRWPTPNNEIQLVGLFDFPSGLGQAACHLYNSLSQIPNLKVTKVNVSGYFNYPGVNSNKKDDITGTGSGVVVFMLNPPEAKNILRRNVFSVIQHKKLVDYVWYESITIPNAWHESLPFFDEVWVDNNFIKDCIEPDCETLCIRIKIRPIVPRFKNPADVSHLVNNNKISVLNIFNLNSGTLRKNPQAIIDAFIALPNNIKQQATLTLKTNADEKNPQFQDLKKQAETHQINLINTKLSDEELSGLIKSCDIYISLHRTEGLGLLPLQAMSYGKPVIATGWSGNMSYMTDDSSVVIGYEIKTNNYSLHQKSDNLIASDKAIFKGNVIYAEPNVKQASDELSQLIASAEKRLSLGLKAQQRYIEYSQAAVKRLSANLSAG